MTKNNRTNFEGILEDNAEKARLTSEEVNLNSADNPKHHAHGRCEAPQQKSEAERNHFIDDERVVEFDDDRYDG